MPESLVKVKLIVGVTVVLACCTWLTQMRGFKHSGLTLKFWWQLGFNSRGLDRWSRGFGGHYIIMVQ